MKFETLSKVLATLLVTGVWLCAHAQSAPEGVGPSGPPEDATPPSELREDVANENSDETTDTEAEEETATTEEVSAPEPSEPSPMSFAALLKSSPFKSIAKNSIRGGSSAASNQIQFRGMIKIGNETEYGLYDPVSQRSYWIKLRDRNRYGIYAESYDAKNKTLTIQSTATGKLSLALAKPDESPLAFSSNAAYRQASSGNNMGFGRGGPQMNNRRGDMQQGQGFQQGQGSQQGQASQQGQGQNQGQGQGQGQFQNRRGGMNQRGGEGGGGMPPR